MKVSLQLVIRGAEMSNEDLEVIDGIVSSLPKENYHLEVAEVVELGNSQTEHTAVVPIKDQSRIRERFTVLQEKKEK